MSMNFALGLSAKCPEKEHESIAELHDAFMAVLDAWIERNGYKLRPE
jgi:hypothetical protein